MYDAPPVRRRKTSITRSRDDCERCRKGRRKVYVPTMEFCIAPTDEGKCDEGRPSCSRCKKAGQNCQYRDLVLQFRDASGWAAANVKKVKQAMSSQLSDIDPLVLTSQSVIGNGNGTPSKAHLDFEQCIQSLYSHIPLGSTANNSSSRNKIEWYCCQPGFIFQAPVNPLWS